MSVITDLGKILLFPVGEWSSSSTYEFLDIVYNGGTSYVAKQAVPSGILLTNEEYWQILASGNIGSIINDTKGQNDTNYVWSADKCYNEFAAVGAHPETDISFTVQGSYLNTSGKSVGGVNYNRTDFIEITGNELKYKLTFASNLGTICFYSSNNESSFISAIIGEGSSEDIEGAITSFPNGAKYYRASIYKSSSQYESCYLKEVSNHSIPEIMGILADQGDEISDLSDDVDAVEEALTLKLDSYLEVPKPFPNSGYIKADGRNAGGNGTFTDFIPIENNAVAIDYNLARVTNAMLVYFYRTDSAASSSCISGIEGTGADHTMCKGTVTIPEGAKYFRAGQWNESGVTGYYVRQRFSTNSIVQKMDANEIRSEANSNSIEILQLMESINKPFDFSGKKIAAFGDSITAGVRSPNLQTGTPYIRYFADHVGATLDNKASSGTCIADNGQYSIYTRITTYTSTTDPDFFIIAGGTNDYGTNKVLGTFSSTAGTDTFYGALKGICNFLETNYPNANVIWITPIPRPRDNGVSNTAGHTLNDYRRAIYEIGTLYGHSVVNGADLGMPTGHEGWQNAMCDDTDGVHPTEIGHKLYARNLAEKLC